MTGILAIETATDACSVALDTCANLTEYHEVTPRAHSQRLFQLLTQTLGGASLAELGVGAIAYGSGPGSFTGLRIAASAAQGLAFSSGVVAVGVPTLAILAQTALRLGIVQTTDTVLSTIDARLNEVYAAVYRFESGIAVLQEGPWACAPGALAVDSAEPLVAVGSGCHSKSAFDDALATRIAHFEPDLLPVAKDMLPLARGMLERDETQLASQVSPVYVRDEITWKKLHEQGKQQ